MTKAGFADSRLCRRFSLASQMEITEAKPATKAAPAQLHRHCP